MVSTHLQLEEDEPEQAGGRADTQSSESLRTRPEPPSLTEGWRAEVESGYGEVHEPALDGYETTSGKRLTPREAHP